MENSSYVLVLTGAVLPGYTAESVWPALAAYFRMEPDKLQQQLLVRAPLTIKQSEDLGKLQTLQSGAAAIGAEAEICAPDGRVALFVLLDRTPRGPVPRGFVEERVGQGVWPDSIDVAEVGSSTWRPFRDFVGAAAIDAMPPPITEAPVSGDAATRIGGVLAPTIPRDDAAAGPHAASHALPPGAAIHAGFWRRCAAYVIDYFITFVASYAIGFIAGIGLGASQGEGALSTAPLLGGLLGLIFGWLYFAMQESSATQATLGKRAFGIKVTDDYGQRIGFGRASGRFFGKIVSGIILCIGFMLAGWTARKQALHDMLAGTVVVFDDVHADQALPSVRPPMPWYGWLLNILLIGSFVLVGVASFMFASTLASVATGGQSGSGF